VLHCATHLDSHVVQCDTQLTFFRHECHNGDRPQLSVRNAHAGLFTDAELASSIGCLWSPEEQEIVVQPRLDPPAVATRCTSFDRGQIEAFASGAADFERAPKREDVSVSAF